MSSVPDRPSAVHSNHGRLPLSIIDDADHLAEVVAILGSPHTIEPDGAVVQLPAWLDEQASWFKSLGTPAADFLAGEIEALAFEARELDTFTLGDYLRRRPWFFDRIESFPPIRYPNKEVRRGNG